ncbi:MAG TPA: META domain-containing protein [Agromyces sp.]
MEPMQLGNRQVGRRFGRALGFASVALATIALAAGCASPGGPGGSDASSPTPTASSAVGTWGDASDASSPSLSLAADGTLTGTDGCNLLTGRWEDQGPGRIEFDDVASTRMACEGVDTWLSGLDEATIDGDTMTVLGDDDVELGVLERTSAEPAGGTGSPAPTDAGAASAFVGTWGTDGAQQAFLVIAADGTVTGSDGCNSLTGRWEPEDGDRIEFDQMASTLVACDGVDQSLAQLDSASVDGDTLTVYDDHDAVVATLPRTA